LLVKNTHSELLPIAS